MGICLFYEVFNSEKIIIKYAINPYNICEKNPELWKNIKIIFIISFVISTLIISYYLTKKIQKIINKKYAKNDKKINKKIIKNNKKIENNCEKIKILIGKNEKNNEKIFLEEAGLYQNILITGTIGTRKNKQCNVSDNKTNNKI